jgi:flagellar hook protein FlgE
MLSALQSVLSGLSCNERGIAAAAENIANLNTDGYRARDAAGNLRRPYDPPPAGLPEGAPAPSDVDLAEEAIELKRYEVGYRAAATAAAHLDRQLGELIDLLA